MAMITTILVPTDGSTHANKAVELAADIASKYGSKLILLHVIQRGSSSAELRRMAEVEHMIEPHMEVLGQTMANMGAGMADALHVARSESVPVSVLDSIGRSVLQHASGLAKNKGATDVETVIEDGDAAQMILESAEKHGANLIVMGNRGLSDLKGLLLGSVSHKVSHLAECTCMTVR